MVPCIPASASSRLHGHLRGRGWGWAQEYGICFTTVDRSAPGELPGAVAGAPEAPLPAVLAAILGERRKVKNLLKNPRLDPVGRRPRRPPTRHSLEPSCCVQHPACHPFALATRKVQVFIDLHYIPLCSSILKYEHMLLPPSEIVVVHAEAEPAVC